jgi:PiT family inorganic phosphate transporter
MPGATVRWGLAGRMLGAWMLTLPAAGLIGALCYWVQHGVGGVLGSVLVLGILLASAAAIWIASRRRPVDHTNVNEAWDEERGAGIEAVAATTGEAGPLRVAPVETGVTTSAVAAAIDAVDSVAVGVVTVASGKGAAE